MSLASTSDLVTRPIGVKIWEFYVWLLSVCLYSLHGYWSLLLPGEGGKGLADLPSEVVSQILMHLDCSSILAVRQVPVLLTCCSA